MVKKKDENYKNKTIILYCYVIEYKEVPLPDTLIKINYLYFYKENSTVVFMETLQFIT